jgi:hypothetical protein
MSIDVSLTLFHNLISYFSFSELLVLEIAFVSSHGGHDIITFSKLFGSEIKCFDFAAFHFVCVYSDASRRMLSLVATRGCFLKSQRLSDRLAYSRLL